jgi:threonine/homoserine/homoserine lactone efflux protein
LVGDFAFIILAVYGLSTLSQALGGLFLIVKYIGAVYLVWLGVKIILSKNGISKDLHTPLPNHSLNFVAGLFTTLGNPKVMIFYMSIFPAFLDLSIVSYLDLGLILLLVLVSVGGVMLLYVCLASKASSLVNESQSSNAIKLCSGAMLVGSGAYIVTRA